MFCLKNHETRMCKKAYFNPFDEKLSVIKKKVNIKGKKTQRKARIILDTGSERSYIKKSTAEDLDGEYSCSLDVLDQDIKFAMA
ncbi:UNVERIFIED_CONTAM: hypothetical protein NCL1_31228 [Trichonephila clavipes]